MRRFAPLVVLAGIAALSTGCSQPSNTQSAAQADNEAGQAEPAQDGATTRTRAPEPETTQAPGIGDGTPDLSPAPLTPEAERGEAGARNVLLSFIRAIELKEFGQAHALMRGEAREGTTAQGLAGRFEGFGTITVAAPSGTIEGAAGTSYYSAPVTIAGSNGPTLSGEIVLSRVNDVPGASEDQLRWRVARFELAGDR